jgi:hypothetical protein
VIFRLFSSNPFLDKDTSSVATSLAPDSSVSSSARLRRLSFPHLCSPDPLPTAIWLPASYHLKYSMFRHPKTRKFMNRMAC